MNSTIKKIICLIAVLAFCFAEIPYALVANADEKDPELSSRCKTVIEVNGKETTFGTVGSDLRINTKIKFDAATDLSAVDIIELSVYVQDADALKNFISDDQEFGLYFSSNSSRETRNRSSVGISGQIRQDGWNTVRVRKTDFAGGVNWESVHYIYLGFSNETNVTLPASLAETQVKYKNVCDIYSLPEITDDDEKPAMPEYDVTVSESGIKTKTWGEKYGYTADQIYNADSFDPAIDLSGVDKIEFDIYIKDYVLFKTAVTGKALRFIMASGENRYQGRSAYDFADQITVDGWNHVVIDKGAAAVSNQNGTTDFSAIRWIGCAFWNGANDQNPIGSTAVRIVNIGANIAGYNKLPAAPEYDLSLPQVGIGPKTWGTNYGNTADNIFNKNAAFDPALDLSGVDIIGFDIYIDNFDEFSEAVSGKALRFILASGDNQYKNRTAYDFVNQITNSGWNHVAIEKGVAAIPDENGKTDFSAIKWLGLAFWNNGGDKNPIGKTVVRIANVGADIAEYNKLPDKPNYDLDLPQAGIGPKTWGDQYNYTADRIYKGLDPAVDLSGVDRIGFDIYIADYDEFSQYMANKAMRFILASGDNQYKNRTAYDIVNQITKSGWNHVVIEKGIATISDENGKTDFAAIKWLGLALWNGGTDKNPIGKTMVRIANVGADIAEYSKLPAKPDYDLDLPQAGIGPKTWGDQYNYTSDRIYKGLDPAVDLSGVDFISFDIYIDDYDKFSEAVSGKALRFILASGDNQYKNRTAYDFVNQITASGWNRVTIEKGIATVPDENGKTDFTAIKWLGLAFWNGGTDKSPIGKIMVRIANVGANVAEYSKLPDKPDYDLDLPQAGIGPKTWGDQYNYTADRIYKGFDPAVDLSGVDLIGFDIYIEDYDEFSQYMANKAVRFILASGDSQYKNRTAYDFVNQITTSGWNHIVIEKGISAIPDENGKTDFSNIKWLGLALWNGGTDKNPIGKTMVRIANVGADIAEYSKLPEKPDYDLDLPQAGIGPKTWGDQYNYTSDRIYKGLDPAVDLSGVDYIGFDIYIKDYDEFSQYMANKAVRFILASGDSQYKNRTAYDFVNQITKSGWNHIVIEKGISAIPDENGKTDFAAIKWLGLALWNGGTDKNPIGKTMVRIANVGADIAEYSKLPEKPDYDLDLPQAGIGPKTWGDQYNYTSDRIYKGLDPAVDLSGVDMIGFDIYIADYDDFKQYITNKSLRFILASGESRFKNRSAYNIVNQITTSGWNHIVIDKGQAAVPNENGNTDFTSIKWLGLAFWDGANVKNPIGGVMVRIANVGADVAEYNKLPALPDNVVAQLGNSKDGTDRRGNTVGEYFHYTMDRIYCHKLTPVDFSRAQVVEFDVYVSDYEKFLAADNDPTDKEDSKLNFVVSSTIPALWEQYSKPAVYYSAGIDLAPYIKHSGWNHISVGKGEFVTYNHGVNWSGLTGYMVYYRHSSNIYPYKNANKDLYVKVANIVNTGVVADIPADAEANLKPDSNAAYISSLDGLSDEYGVWNINDPIITTKYKTAGNSSIQKRLDYNSQADEGVMTYIFDTTADMFDLSTVKIDFFIDFPQYLNKPTNNIEFCIANDRFLNSNYLSWNVDLSSLKQGWNELSFNISEAKAVGTPNLNAVKAIVLRFTELDLAKENYEEITYGIDNLRYISSAGSKILKVEGLDSEDDNYGNYEFDLDISDEGTDSLTNLAKDDSESSAEDDSESPARVKYKKLTERLIVTDWLYTGIVLGGEALVIAAGVTVFILLYRRKRKKSSE